MARTRDVLISFFLFCALVVTGSDGVVAAEVPSTAADPNSLAASSDRAAVGESPSTSIDVDAYGSIRQAGFFESLTDGNALPGGWVAPMESAEFPGAYQIPGTETWWKFGGFIKGDLIHDFQPAGMTDRFVPTTIPTDGREGQNTLMQAKATRFNLDIRAPSDWGTARGFFEADFFTADSSLRIRHAYAEVGPFIAGQTWTTFTDPNGIPHLLDLESPIAFITLRQAQFRWTRPIGEHLRWAIAVEDPTTSVDDVVMATIPGEPEQPVPDLATHLKYKNGNVEWFVGGLIRDVSYRPNGGSAQDRLGWATNFVGILHPTERDKLIGQFVFGDGLGRYRSGSDLRLGTPSTVDTVHHTGACVALTHQWSPKWSSTVTHSVALRRKEPADPPDTTRFVTYSAANLIWQPIDSTTMGIEYLYGTNEAKDGAFGFANRIQISVQYNFR